MALPVDAPSSIPINSFPGRKRQFIQFLCPVEPNTLNEEEDASGTATGSSPLKVATAPLLYTPILAKAVLVDFRRP